MKYLYLLTPVLSLLLGLPRFGTAAESFSNVYIFGDSISDTGNLAVTPGFEFLGEPPFDNGFSNGPRAVEVLAENLGLTAEPSMYLAGLNEGTNYAVSGARARGDALIDLRSQVDAFLFATSGNAPSDALYVVAFGGNDVRDARDKILLTEVVHILNEAVESIDQAIRTLVASGAKTILVINSPNVASVPETRAIAQTLDIGEFIFLTRLKTRFFNRRLSDRMAKIEQDFGLDIVEFNLFSFLQSVLRDSMALGFTERRQGCFSSITFSFNPDCEDGANFDRFIFFDEFHPTAALNQRAGRALFALAPDPHLSTE